MSENGQDKEFREVMRVKYDYTNLTSDSIGKEHGISNRDIKGHLRQIERAIEDLKGVKREGKLGFYELPYNYDVVNEVLEFAEMARAEYDNFVVLGIGGSALGCVALHTALSPMFYNMLPKEDRKNSPRIFFVDNIDPDLIQGLFRVIDIRKTLFNVITKSGSTAETIANFLVFYGCLKNKEGILPGRNVVATTTRNKGALFEIAKKEGFKLFFIPENVGGRFSVFSPVGLLSSAMAGIDIKELLAGARFMDKICSCDDIFKNPAYMNAVCHFILHTKKAKNIHVMMPYANRLKDVADWFRQLWAESLGKKYNLKGEVVYTGPTPVKALGATDQHSQIQLYVEGPNDKIITFITVEDFESSVTIPDVFHDIETTEYLANHTINELIKNEQLATELALTKNNRPNCKFRLPAITPFTVGQLLFLLEVQTALSGFLYGINAFDQPGVEEGKIATYALMGRNGYEAKYKEICDLFSNVSPMSI